VACVVDVITYFPAAQELTISFARMSQHLITDGQADLQYLTFFESYGITTEAEEMRWKQFYQKRVYSIFKKSTSNDTSLVHSKYETGKVVFQLTETMCDWPRDLSQTDFRRKYTELIAPYNTFEQFGCMGHVMDFGKLAFDPMIWMTIVDSFTITANRNEHHRAASRSYFTLMKYCRWLNRLDLFDDNVRQHLSHCEFAMETAKKTGEVLVLESINKSETRATKAALRVVIAIRCGLRNRATDELKQVKSEMLAVFEELGDVVEKGETDVRAWDVGTDNSSTGENVYLTYANQMKATVDTLESMITEGDTFGHYALHKSYRELKPLELAITCHLWHETDVYSTVARIS